MFIVSCLIAVYYNMVTAWAIYYLIASITIDEHMPWATCFNDWNTDSLLPAAIRRPCDARARVLWYRMRCVDVAQVPRVRHAEWHTHQQRLVHTRGGAAGDEWHRARRHREPPPARVQHEWAHVAKRRILPVIFVFFLSSHVSSTYTCICSRKMLNLSEGIDHIGHIQWELVIYLLLAWLLTFFGLFKVGARMAHRQRMRASIFRA